MIALRRHIFRHRGWAGWLIALALLAKLIVPSGYMPSASGGRIMVELCSGYGVQKMEVALPGAPEHRDAPGDRGKADMPCAFSGLAAHALAAVDPILLAVAIAFIVATVFRTGTTGIATGAAYLRPPPRGPPANA